MSRGIATDFRLIKHVMPILCIAYIELETLFIRTRPEVPEDQLLRLHGGLGCSAGSELHGDLVCARKVYNRVLVLDQLVQHLDFCLAWIFERCLLRIVFE